MRIQQAFVSNPFEPLVARCRGSVWLLLHGLSLLAASTSSHAAAAKANGFDSARLAEMSAAIEDAISRKDIPGGVLHVERQGLIHSKVLGKRAIKPSAEPLAANTIFDAASLTKVVASAPAIMILVERGQVSLQDPVHKHLPAFRGEGRDAITVRSLLNHTSGLRPGIPRQPAWSGYETGIKLAMAEKPEWPVGTRFRYSDINFILLGEIVARASGVSLDRFVDREIYEPLGMKDTGYRPPASLRKRIAPTEPVDGRMLRGVVHDPTARLMGGVAGHAGLFTTASDLARFARMMLNKGTLGKHRILQPESVHAMTSVQTSDEVEARRGLGWDIDSGYSRPRGKVLPLGSYGHTGFTGTCLWIDPFSETFWIFLSSRLHPDGKGNVLSLQSELGTLVGKAVQGFDFESVPGALPARRGGGQSTAEPPPVLNGVDVLVRDDFKPLRGRKVGLITNHTGHDWKRRSTIDLLYKAAGVSLVALFSPEHGIRGEADEKVGDGVDARTGLPIYSLYGERRSPEPAQLQGLDTLVFDIQDIGVRYYTYISTLANCMEMAARSGTKFVVLDRVNPITGVHVEGPVHTNSPTFVACHPLPLRHGMTTGELARMFREERGWSNLDLMIVPLDGWKRSMWFDETGLPWTNPSPNMRSMAGMVLYPALGFHESALAVGRGTDTPFQIVGAPYADGSRIAAELRKAAIPGARFIPIEFTPNYSTFKGRRCGGVAITLINRDILPAVELGIELARAFQRLYPTEYALEKTRPLLTDPTSIDAIRKNQPLSEIRETWQRGLKDFQKRRTAFLLY